jgi:hypothetical protein
MYRNPHQAAGQRPENDRAPVYVDFSLDLAIYAVDAKGNAALTQTVLGVQAAGVATATQGVLDIETASSMEMELLGVTAAPSNLILELITDEAAVAPVDATPPTLVATYPAANANDLSVDTGIELIFSEPVDLDRLRAGGVALQTSGGTAVAARVESHGAAVVLRPVSPLPYGASFKVVFTDVRDLAGNAAAPIANLVFATPALAATGVAATLVSVYPGAPCALNGTQQCTGGQSSDDSYAPFTLAANDTVRVVFDAPIPSGSAVHGTTCGTGTVRIERLNAAGACASPVPGTMVVHDRQLVFIPDAPWVVGAKYRFTLVPSAAENFDPLNGVSGGGSGASLIETFVGAPATDDTLVLTLGSPFTDQNGSGYVDGSETARDQNHAELRITGTGGAVSQAHFTGADCDPSTASVENCMYLSGAVPTAIGPLQMNCNVPGAGTADCLPVRLSPEAMLGTSVTMNATLASVFSTDNDTGMSVMRLREPSGGPITGMIIDGGGSPTFVVALDLYDDAPDMSLTASSHDLHSKPLSVLLRGPVTILPDGRFSIALANAGDVSLTINITAIGFITGSVDLLIPAGQMKLQLLSPPVRGGAP